MLSYIDIEYTNIGKRVTTGGTTYNVFGETSTSGISWSYGSSVSGEDNFNCSGLDYGNYVLAWICRFRNDTGSNINIAYNVVLQAKVNGSRMRRAVLFSNSEVFNGGKELHSTMPVNAETGIYNGATEYRVIITLVDRTHNQSEMVYSYFTCTNVPASSANISCSYLKTGKGIAIDGSLYYNLYGEEFNPSEFVRPSRSTCTAYNETSVFNLQGFQPGHEVGVAVANISNTGAAGASTHIVIEILRKNDDTNEWEQFMTPYEYTNYINPGEKYAYFIYFGVDYDEIWTGYTNYIAKVTYDSAGGDGTNTYSFSVSNLSIDSVAHSSGFLWVNGTNLFYTDGVLGSTGYKHSIAYEGNYNELVGTEYAGAIWIDPSYPMKLTYVDEYGYKRRTHSGSQRYSGSTNVGTQYSGKIWVAAQSGMEDGYGYLCFVDPGGYLVRMGNGPVNGIE